MEGYFSRGIGMVMLIGGTLCIRPLDFDLVRANPVAKVCWILPALERWTAMLDHTET